MNQHVQRSEFHYDSITWKIDRYKTNYAYTKAKSPVPCTLL